MGQLNKEKAAITTWMAEWRAEWMCVVAEERGHNAGVVGGMEKHVVRTQTKRPIFERGESVVLKNVVRMQAWWAEWKNTWSERRPNVQSSRKERVWL